MTSTSGSLQTPIFTENTYEYWSLTMKYFIRGKYVWEIVHHGYGEWADMSAYNNLRQVGKYVLREHRKKDGKALFYIHQAMNESILPIVVAQIIPKIWYHSRFKK